MDYLKRLVNCGMQKDIALWMVEHLPPDELELLVEQTEEEQEQWLM